jgi:hypothetical protein
MILSFQFIHNDKPWLAWHQLSSYVVTHGHVCHVIIVVNEFRFDMIPMNSDGLAVEDEELPRPGVIYLASAPAEVMILERLPLSLCRAELHLMYAMITGSGEEKCLRRDCRQDVLRLLPFIIVDADGVPSCES